MINKFLFLFNHVGKSLENSAFFIRVDSKRCRLKTSPDGHFPNLFFLSIRPHLTNALQDFCCF